MDCKNKVNNEVCGKCNCNVLSIDFLLNKDILKVIKIAANIVWMEEFERSAYTEQVIKSLYINCDGTVTINRINNNKLDVSMAIHIYSKIVKNWYNVHSFNKELDSYTYIKEQIKDISKFRSISKLRVRAILITKYIESITTCNGNCTTVVPGKEVGNCKIRLSDINKIVRFSSEGLADVLNTIFYTIKDVAVFSLTIDLNTTYIVCNGNITMDRNFVKSGSTVADMKRIYIYYLSAWCSANVSKESEITKIRNNINEVKNIRYMHEMYDLSSNLLELLSGI